MTMRVTNSNSKCTKTRASTATAATGARRDGTATTRGALALRVSGMFGANAGDGGRGRGSSTRRGGAEDDAETKTTTRRAGETTRRRGAARGGGTISTSRRAGGRVTSSRVTSSVGAARGGRAGRATAAEAAATATASAAGVEMTGVERASAEGDGRVIRITAPASVRRALLRDYEDSRGTDPRPYERPRATAREIFRAFLEEQRTTTDSRGKPLSAASVARAEKTCAGLERAFDDALERALLYKDEWHQRSPLPPSETYGAVHLLRMLVKLPAIFPPESFADVKSATILQSKANELVRFVCAKASDFGVADAFASHAPIRPPSTPDNVDEPPSRV